MRKYQVVYLLYTPAETIRTTEEVFADFVRVEGDFVVFYEIATADEFIMKASFWRPVRVVKMP
jgi:hypothetical protein